MAAATSGWNDDKLSSATLTHGNRYAGRSSCEDEKKRRLLSTLWIQLLWVLAMIETCARCKFTGFTSATTEWTKKGTKRPVLWLCDVCRGEFHGPNMVHDL